MAIQRDQTDWSPRSARRPARLIGLIRCSNVASATVLVSNLSYSGCQVWSDYEFVQGETVELVLPGRGEIQAQVRWLDGPKAGLKFLTDDLLADARRARLGVQAMFGQQI